MVVHLHRNFILIPKFQSVVNLSTSSSSRITCSLMSSSDHEESARRIGEVVFNEVKFSTSAYDTAWVAMVPSREFPAEKPCFPGCLDWVLENQQKDGSWSGLQSAPGQHKQQLLLKDSLLSTLACLLVLRKWRVGEQLLLQGLEYIKSNAFAAFDPHQVSPVGFDVLFPGIIKQAKLLDLNMPLDATLLDLILKNHELKIARIQGNETALAYFAEGVGTSCSWKEVLKVVQRPNGLILGSPAATAAALNQHFDYKLFANLCKFVNQSVQGVPTIHPQSMYIPLKLVDVVERLGLKRYFTLETERILNETYRSWKRRDEDIVSDVTCVALAFRHLRLRGYEVSSEELVGFADEESFFRTISPQFTGMTTILELYRASQYSLTLGDEVILGKINAWTGAYLKQQLLNQSIIDRRLRMEVQSTLKNYHGALERVVNRQFIEQYNVDEVQMLKTAYRCFNISNTDLLNFSISDFNACQSLHQDELKQLERWFGMNGLRDVNAPKNVLHSAYYLIAADMFEPQLSGVRISYSQTVILLAIVDDMFDKAASREELINIIDLVKIWDKHSATTGNWSKKVEVFFLALYNTVEEMSEKAFAYQGRCIKQHLITLWQELLEGMMTEVDWWCENRAPNMDEYLSVGARTIGCDVCILTSIYFIGPILSQDVITSEEIRSLCKHVGIVSRLLNDLQTWEVS
ncbi:OLC1v1002124C1 [Oldenlandia corymbosa var. corymbosa]|uniref:OLC1v1002124C1 n=1 Tax=Oldenlandia corymbosa var. corymbosa TaxID=529605 RepID=A0AAV1D9T3_OLDCO|nr:OLC1v1002124C1 [Oldenlandia corymbosa var. corymbosa]